MSSYKHVNSNAATVQVQTGTTRLKKVVVGTTGTAWTLTLYDSATAGACSATNTIGVVTASDGGNYDFEVTCTDGLFYTTAGTTPGDLTIVFG